MPLAWGRPFSACDRTSLSGERVQRTEGVGPSCISSIRCFVDAQRGVACEHVEVDVGVQNGSVLPDSDGSDQAVDELADGLSAPSAHAVERCGGLMVGRSGRKGSRPSKETPKLTEVDLVSCSGQDFHPDRIANRDVAGEESIHLDAGH